MSMLPLTPDPREPRAVVDAEGVHWESREDALFVGRLGMCGCGFSEEIGADVSAWLQWRAACITAWAGYEFGSGKPHPETPASPLADRDDVYVDLIAHLLDRAGLTEHGGSVGGSWLLPEGKAWVEALRAGAAQ